MSVALQIIQMIFYIVGILFMLSFMFIGIWSFIIFLKMYKNQRINNYLLDKINKSISSLNLSNDESVLDSLDFDFDDSFLDNNNLDSTNNVIKMDNA
ncbi:hypothetical protein H8S10_15880 [Clostridium sp. NSJ-49]|jgi:hypothetical protein|uniref:Uncharacterized protein n=1 Tax=Clostridium disporicum TaxID=84024 RepID=A0A174HJQ5_9CLOT|nr:MULTISPECIES: hypothetical protein [Clostridium]MBC5626920.1 hypothetical protein [Clostridium sp. NSJ-49]MCD2503251.1 hypothetical protein [Clostridium sp. NSJ-145]CUO75134.1 Uncharacterised protein [Clostridium disporicum]